MMLVDSHLHVCLPNTPESPWPEWALRYQQTCGYPSLIEELLAGMDAAGVERAYVHVPTWFCDRDEYALKAAIDHPERFRTLVRPAVHDPISPERTRRWATHSGVRGLRVVYLDNAFADTSAARWLHDGTSEWLFRLAVEFDLPVMLFAPDQNEAVADLASRYPNLKIILDNLNCPGHHAPSNGEYDYLKKQMDTLLPLARFRNVGVKLKTWNWQLHAEPYPFPAVRPVLDSVIKSFGADRCFWAGDFNDYPDFTYTQLIGMFLEMPSLSNEEKELVMGRAALNWLGWD